MTEKQVLSLSSAKKYFEDNLYDKALPILNSLVSNDVQSPNVHHMLGSIHFENGRFKEAILNFKKALQINPDFTDSAIGLSVILNDLGKYKQAQHVFLTAQKRLKTLSDEKKTQVHLKPQIAQKHLELSDLYAQDNQTLQAVEQLIIYERLVGESTETVIKKTQLLKKSAKYELASKILREWIQSQNTREPEFLYELSELYYLSQKPLAALSSCEELLKLDPHHFRGLKLYNKLKSTTFDLRPKETL